MKMDDVFEYKTQTHNKRSKLKLCLGACGICALITVIIWGILILNAEPCPDHIRPMPTFDVQKYKGTWYELYRVKATNYGQSGNCTVAKYGNHPDGISVWNMEWFGQKPDQTTNDIRGKAYQPDGKSGALKVKFDNFFIPEAPYNVINTDYNSFSLVYSCSLALGFKKYEFLWFLTRNPIETGTQQFKTWSTRAIAEIMLKFKTDKPENKKYIDTDNYLLAPMQGKKYCQYDLMKESGDK